MPKRPLPLHYIHLNYLCIHSYLLSSPVSWCNNFYIYSSFKNRRSRSIEQGIHAFFFWSTNGLKERRKKQKQKKTFTDPHINASDVDAGISPILSFYSDCRDSFPVRIQDQHCSLCSLWVQSRSNVGFPALPFNRRLSLDWFLLNRQLHAWTEICPSPAEPADFQSVYTMLYSHRNKIVLQSSG